MKRTLLVLIGLVVLLSPAVSMAAPATSGSTVIDTDNYVPSGNGQYVETRGNILGNPGFETGNLPPWTSTNWFVQGASVNTGSYAAEDNGNYFMQQDFAPTAVGAINAITMYAMQPSGISFQAVDFLYADNTYDEFLVAPGANWTYINMTSNLRGSGQLTGIRIWGYSSTGNDITRVDDVVVDTNVTPAEMSNWGRIKALYR